MKRGSILVCAYVLIQTALGRALEVVEEVAKVDGVQKACAVTGAYDIVATVDVEKLTDVADLVVNKIHHVEGVCGTQTLICVTC
ncbi:MAG: Lrp/AsnC ligand binding domain-containing protein [Candidatus Bathyarchaeota archaeon]|nr:Lrp/AsnC ligand binding domain-containing protein [Candidatus Bathyarchaeota archaeon]